MVIRPRVLSICTGIGGFELALRIAMPEARTVCYVEREVFPLVHLVQAMEAGVMDEAPVWSDLRTFDGKPWRGKVDWIIGGIPCQPYSTAGKRRGVEDERNLWPDTARIIKEIQPRYVFLENVKGILRYYYDALGPELQEMGFRTKEGLFSAAEIGGPHRRKRLYILAHRRGDGWRRGSDGDEGRKRCSSETPGSRGKLAVSGMGDAGSGDERNRQREMEWSILSKERWYEGHDRFDASGGGMADCDSSTAAVSRDPGRPGLGGESAALADSSGISRAVHVCQGRPREEDGQVGGRGDGMANCCEGRWGESVEEVPARERNTTRRDGKVADTDCEGRERQRSCPGNKERCGSSVGKGGSSMAECSDDVRPLVTFPPGPNALEDWSQVLTEMPPLEPAFCSLADGLSHFMDATQNRYRRLAGFGNAVVPLVAAHALRVLKTRLDQEINHVS